LNAPAGLAIADGGASLLVADSGNSRLQKFSSAGAFALEFSGLADLQFPTYVAVDAESNAAHVAELLKDRITKFNATSGAYLNQTHFLAPVGIASGASGDVFVASNALGDVTRFGETTLGRLSWQVNRANGPSSDPVRLVDLAGLAADSKANVIVLVPVYNTVQVCNSRGAFLGALGFPGATFSQPQGVAVDRNDHVYVLDWPFFESGQGDARLTGRVQRFALTGELVASWIVSEGSVTPVGPKHIAAY
jgi:DNA-binding beta-propeller fold protein YncE